ncbi:MAG TPA: Atxe2 family lasso peptide isopeptidase [Allosphingosinicella sp.]|jgi:dipeptidyl aminopeptidase/acylaminoacyl peptidase
MRRRRKRVRLALSSVILIPLGAPEALHGREPGATVRELVEIADISGLAASPDGRSVAFRTDRAQIDRNSYALEWRTADVANGQIRELGGGGEPIYRNPGLLQTETPSWSPDGKHLFYRALIDGRIGIWRAASDGSSAAPVVAGDADVESVDAESGGTALFYNVGPSRDEIVRAERREYDAGILVDQHVDLAQNLFRGGWINGRLASQRMVGRWFERSDLLAKAPRRRHRLDLSTLAEVEVAVPPPAPASTRLPEAPAVRAVSRTGDVASASWDGTSGRLLLRRRGSGAAISCEAAACSGQRIAALAWRPRRDELLITSEDAHHAQSLYLWRPSAGVPRLLASSDGLLNGGRDPDTPCALTEDAAVCVAASAASPPLLERIAFDSGARTVLFDPNARIRGQDGPIVEHLSWRVPGGRQFTGVLMLPRATQAARRLPLFLTFYRCEGFLRGGVGDEWPLQTLVGAGFAAACVNAAPIVGKYDPVDAYDEALAALQALVERLDGRNIIDRRRVAMGGLSFGSEVTMWVATHSDLLAAASISSTQLEPAYYWFNAVRGRDQPQKIREAWGLGPPDQTAARWQRVSSALNVSRIKAPLLMQLPEQEARYVIELYARLTNTTTPTELYAFPDEAHVKLQPRHKLAVYQRNLDWFRFWLQDYVDPDPEKAEQYHRWRALSERRKTAPASPIGGAALPAAPSPTP